VEKQIKLSQLQEYHDRIWQHAAKEFGFQNISASQITTVELNWAELLVRFLTSSIVSSLLMFFGFLGLYMEFRTPGFGLFGTIGLACLGLFFWGHFLVRLAGWEELLLFVAGIVLLGIEIFVIPGFGIVGILGIIAIISSLALAMMGQQFELITFPDVSSALMRVTVALLISILVSLVLAGVLGKFFPRTGIGKRVILSTTQEHGAGYVAQAEDRNQLIGMIGVTLTPVHPSGTVMINDKRYDVVSEGEFIDKNVEVKVLEVEGARIVVRKIDETTNA
jgi:membrane-bound serine protease (ClpP class)